MTLGRLLALALLATLLLLAGTAGAEPQITDPDDDARVRTTQAFSLPSCNPCNNVVGEKAPDALELLSVTFDETPRDLVVRFQVASLEEGLEGAVSTWEPTDTSEVGPGDHDAVYVVCWTTIDDECTEGLVLQAWRTRGGISTRSTLLFASPDCTPFIPCQYLAPYTVEEGSPGAIEWRVPRMLLPNATEGDTLAAPMAFIHRTEDKGDPVFFEVDGLLWSQLTGDRSWSYTVDHALEGAPFTFQTPLDPSLSPALSSASVQDPPDDFKGPDRDDLDVLNVTLGADQQNFTVSVQLAQVAQDARDHTVFVNGGFRQGIPMFQLLTWVEDGERQFAGQGWSSHENSSQLEVHGTVVPGQPGWVNLSTPLADLPVVGQRVAWMWAGALSETPMEEVSPITPFLERLGTRVSSDQTDVVGPGTAYNVTPAATAPEPVLPTRDNTTVRIDDAVGDARFPAEASLLSQAPEQNDATSYELTRVGVEAESPTLLQLSLEIRNLSRVRVPHTYDGVLYAAAIETPQGRFMAVAHYQADPADDETTAEWFCTSDTSVLTEQPSLPPPGIPIQGFLRPSQAQGSTETQGSGVDAMVRFDLPRECLADAPPGPLDIHTLGGGVFLVRNTPGQGPSLDPVDTAVAEVRRTVEAAPLTLASTNAPSAGAAGGPFGIDNFWDILGIAGTLVASAFGAVLVRRRRSALKDYLREIDRILAEHPRDPSGRETTLRRLEGQAKDDLVKGRLSENQYVVVRTRLTEELAEARGKSIEEAFGELPHRLLAKLKHMATDGTLSPEDRRLFSALLEDSELKESAKERVRRKLDAWAKDDASPE